MSTPSSKWGLGTCQDTHAYVGSNDSYFPSQLLSHTFPGYCLESRPGRPCMAWPRTTSQPHSVLQLQGLCFCSFSWKTLCLSTWGLCVCSSFYLQSKHCWGNLPHGWLLPHPWIGCLMTHTCRTMCFSFRHYWLLYFSRHAYGIWQTLLCS